MTGIAGCRKELEKGNFGVKCFDRKLNTSDMLTHSPSAEELRKFLPMIGCHTMAAKRENYNAVKTMLKAMRRGSSQTRWLFGQCSDWLSSGIS